MVSSHREWIVLELRAEWDLEGPSTLRLLLGWANYDRWMKGKRDVTVLFTPTDSTSLASHRFTRNHLVLNVMEHVRNKLIVLTPFYKGAGRLGEESDRRVARVRDTSAWPVDDEESTPEPY